jgi:hypothetical protein
MTAQPQADTPQLLLEHHLKALRLPTILREYDIFALESDLSLPPECVDQRSRDINVRDLCVSGFQLGLLVDSQPAEQPEANGTVMELHLFKTFAPD